MSIQFDWSIIKADKDGNQVISDVLHEGETLADGTTYDELYAAVVQPPEPSPFAQGSMKEDIQTDDLSPALTLDPSGDHTMRAGDKIDGPAEFAEFESDLKATESEDGNSTIVVDTETGEIPESNQVEKTDEPEVKATESEDGSSTAIVSDDDSDDDDSDDDTEYLDPPKPSDSKPEWLAYARAKGYDGDDSITKNELIDKYGN